MELFEKNREGMPGDSSMTGVLFRINYFFEGWLHFEKGLPEKRALELSMAVNNLLRSKMMEKIDKRSEGENAKILKFPPPENRRR
ncbi:MAG: hypothetical protein FJZ04_03605 [Candidatus Moranbacteria bacterium]|nr:hypothetical protein [Candidatus Moranbacteria bacterium]